MRALALTLGVLGLVVFAYTAFQYLSGVYQSTAETRIAASRPPGTRPAADTSRDLRERDEASAMVTERVLYGVVPGAACLLAGIAFWLASQNRTRKMS